MHRNYRGCSWDRLRRPVARSAFFRRVPLRREKNHKAFIGIMNKSRFLRKLHLLIVKETSEPIIYNPANGGRIVSWTWTSEQYVPNDSDGVRTWVSKWNQRFGFSGGDRRNALHENRRRWNSMKRSFGNDSGPKRVVLQVVNDFRN